jgi:hypothetical protein
VTPEGLNDMQEHKCSVIMGPLGTTNHYYDILKSNSWKVYSLGISQPILGIALKSGIIVSSTCPFYLLVTLRFPSDMYS